MTTPAQITSVLSARYTAVPGFIDLEVVVEGYPDATGPVTVPYTWHVNEDYDNSWNVAAWFADHPDFEIASYAPPAIDPGEVKAEAARRIEIAMPTWMVLREFTGGAAVPQANKDAAEAIRQRSNEIEAMQPIPADFRSDSYWT